VKTMTIFYQTQDPDPYDALLAEVRARLCDLNDPEMDEWFIDTLAADLGIPVAIGKHDYMENVKMMGEYFAMAFQRAGDNKPARRAELVKGLMEVIRELMEQIKDWIERDQKER